MVLRRTGFTGVDVEVHDCEDEENYAMSVLMSTADGVTYDYHQDVAIILGNSTPPASWLDGLKKSLASLTSCEPAVENLESTQPEGKTFIFLSEMDKPILDHMDETQFAALRSLLTRSRGVLWLTRGGAVECERPESGLITGLLRTLRCEDNSKRYITLDLDPTRGQWTEIDEQAMMNVFKQAFNWASAENSLEFEYAERGHLIQIPRAFEDMAENDAVAAQPVDPTPEIQPFYQQGRELRLEVGTPGMLDSLVFRDDPSSSVVLPDDFVEIEPKAFGLNFRDLMASMGQLADTELGAECSGVITKIGAGVPGHLKVGDRVCALTKGYYSNYVRLHWSSVGKISDDMSFAVGASIPVVYMTAYEALYNFAHLQKGETVLIHAASGGVGQAAIILSQLVEAEIFATVGTEEKRDFIHKTYGIPHDHIFSSRETSFASSIRAMTNGQGVDVVLNSLAGSLLEETWKCMARFGRFAEIGKRDLELNNHIEMGPFRRCVTFGTIDLIQLATFKTRETARLMADVLQLLEKNEIRPITPITVYPLPEVEKAMRVMQAGKHLGKIIISPSEGDMVKASEDAHQAYQQKLTTPQVAARQQILTLSPDATYLVVGGLGGIGKLVAQRLVERGARYLILLSRSAGSQSNAQQYLDELRSSGCKVMAKSCDISGEADLARVMDECAQAMPSVRGVIQGAMVLKVSFFPNIPSLM
jgi:NADPH:quinone reductase-like Zn-dependent oxidoreductase